MNEGDGGRLVCRAHHPRARLGCNATVIRTRSPLLIPSRPQSPEQSAFGLGWQYSRPNWRSCRLHSLKQAEHVDAAVEVAVHNEGCVGLDRATRQ